MDQAEPVLDYWRLGKAWFSSPWALWALPSHPPKSAGPRLASARPAFTLAETLITLGIIGIVAALTMPALVANHQKKVIVTRLQKFHSVMRQAVNTKTAEDGGLDASMLTITRDPTLMMQYFNVNLAPYLKTISVKELSSGIVVAFPDGSGMYMSDVNANGQLQHPRNYFCVNYKDCENINEILAASTNNQRAVENPHSIFGLIGLYNFSGIWAEDIEALGNACKNNTAAPGTTVGSNGCAAWIQQNGWQIPNDYP